MSPVTLDASMDEVFIQMLAYAVRHQLQLAERLGFGILATESFGLA